MTDIERKRQLLQKDLDSRKSLKERNKMGQFSTPYPLACQICDYMLNLTGRNIESFLEPSMGTGAFYSALSEKALVHRSVGYEIDEHYFLPSQKLWSDYSIQLYNQDFLTSSPKEEFSLIISNPPYSRHHHIPPSYKQVLSERIEEKFGLKISGLAGLHIYFMLLSTLWLKEEGYSCWLVPTECLYVNYGRELKKFLLNDVDLIAIHSFDNKDVQFSDALVSSSVIVFSKRSNSNQTVRFSWGPDINNPKENHYVHKSCLNPSQKWNKEQIIDKESVGSSIITIGTFFRIQRGIATGDNGFFIVDDTVKASYNMPTSVLTPVIPPPRKLRSNIYSLADLSTDNQYLITCRQDIDEIKRSCSGLYEYLKKGELEGVNLRANCKHRLPWYALERREISPILVSYMGRESGDDRLPIRFILNQAGAIATNSYLCLYPKDEYKQNFIYPSVLEKVWSTLTSISPIVLRTYGRSYGGGLLKWEPKELASIPCEELDRILKPLNPSLFD